MSTAADWALRLAEGALGLFGPAHTEFAGPGDAQLDVNFASTGEEDPAFAIGSVYVPLIREYLVREQIRCERELSESGYLIHAAFDYRLVFMANDRGHVSGRVAAVVDDEDGRRFAIELDPPVIDSLVGSDREGSLRDRVRIATYLVCLGGEAVSRLGLGESFLSDAVRTLSALVSALGLTNADGSGNRSHHTDQERDSDSSPRGDVPSIHASPSAKKTPAVSGITTSLTLPMPSGQERTRA